MQVDAGKALPDAVQWVGHALTGTIATAIAIIAIAAIGFAFLQGHVDARRAARTILGCFIIFGAPSIGAALVGIQDPPSVPPSTMPAPAVQALPPLPAPAPYDPYAGASVPVR